MLETNPNMLEKMAVRGLLILEGHSEKNSSSPVNWAGRRQFLEELAGAVVVVGSAATAGFTLRFLWEEYQNQQIAQKRDAYLQSVKNREDYYGIGWQNSADVQLAIKKAKENSNLKILGPDEPGIRFYSQDNILFYQTSNMVVLAIDKKALDDFLQ